MQLETRSDRIVSAVLSRDVAALSRLEEGRRAARPRWVRHGQAQRLIWLDEGSPVSRAIAVDDAGVHLRLTARDHRERTLLTTAAAVEARACDGDTDAPTAAVLRAAWAIWQHWTVTS